MLLSMETKNKLLKLLKIIFVSICLFMIRCKCISENKFDNKTFRFVDSFPIDSINKLYIYHRPNAFNEPSESYFAVGKNYCEIYSVETTTIAFATGYAHIDTIINKVAYATFGGDFEVLDTTINLSFVTKRVKPTDKIKQRLNIYFRNCN